MGKVFAVLGIIIFLTGGGIYYFITSSTTPLKIADKQTEKKPCTLTAKPREFKSEPYYKGPLIDTHIHMPTSDKIGSSFAQKAGFEMPVLEGNLSLDNLVCLFESEGIIQAFGFHTTPKISVGSAVDTAREIEEKYPGKIVNFLLPPPINFLNPEPSTIKDILTKNKDLFEGYGEVSFEKGDFQQASPEYPNFLEMYKIADSYNLIVMMHPSNDQKEAVETILEKFPNVTFLFHGGNSDDWIVDVMKNHKNLYYSLDANTTSLYGFERNDNFGPESKIEFLTKFRKNFDSKLDQTTARWKASIEAYPDRFTWGTDRWYAWHFEQEVGGLLEEFGRAFIGRLDPTVQENFAYKNAEKLLKGQ